MTTTNPATSQVRKTLLKTYHSLESKLLDLLDSPWCSLLELHAENALVEVDGVLAGDNVLDGTTAGVLFRRGGHCDVCRCLKSEIWSSGCQSLFVCEKSGQNLRECGIWLVVCGLGKELID